MDGNENKTEEHFSLIKKHFKKVAINHFQFIYREKNKDDLKNLSSFFIPSSSTFLCIFAFFFHFDIALFQFLFNIKYFYFSSTYLLTHLFADHSIIDLFLYFCLRIEMHHQIVQLILQY